MKICFFNSSKTWGGSEKWHYDMASALHKKGHSILLMTRLQSDLYMRAGDSGIPCRGARVTNLSFLSPVTILWLTWFLRKQHFDAIIINLSADLKLAGISARLAGIRHIIYHRGSAIPVRNTLCNRFLFGQVITRIIASSEMTKRTIVQHNSQLFPLRKITTLYKGIDLEAMDNMPATPLFERKGKEIILGNAGKLVYQKGQQHLIRLAHILEKDGLDFRIVIAGIGPLEHQLRQMAIDAGLEHRIVFSGFVDQMKAFMESVDILVQTSLWEGFGYGLAEAMACRKPVVAFHISSNPEIVQDQVTGYLVAIRDMDAMAARIRELAGNPALRNEMGTKGRQRVEEMFNLAHTREAFEKFLLKLQE